MKLLNWTRTGLTAAVVSLLTCSSACAAESASTVVTVESKKPGVEISDDALGLSYETSLMLPNEQGVRYFRPDNEPLVRMFQTLGVRSLRIGGNSVDAARIPIPSDDDVHSLFRFARKAGVKVIYSVRLEDGDPKSAAHFTRLIRDHYADTLDLFAIGNEPKGYYKDTNVFLAKWTAIRDAMVAEWPAAKFCGPDDNPSPEWCRMMVANFGAPKGPLTQITQHSYSFGCSYKNPGEKDVSKLIPVDVVAAREKMLAPDAYAIYEKIYDGIRSAIDGTSLSFRMTEVNSYWFSGLKGASDSYAAALWGADYLHWWTSHGSDGLNFHTGDRTGGAISLPCRYAAFVTSENGYEARPLAYGMKLFSLAGGGRVLPVKVNAGTNNVVAYANLPEPNVVCVTLINKAHGPGAGNILVQLKLDAALSSEAPRMILLESKNGDISGGSSDVRLGGAAIQEDGSWNGQWSPLPGAKGSDVSFSMPPASAAVVRFVTQ
jgi:hypothetical protein